MKIKSIIPLLLLFVNALQAQDTFSIVAIDSTTGEIGSAGASCLQAPNPPTGCLIISNIIPGLGAAHTQAQWNSYNQTNLHNLMLQHLSPQEILAEVNIDDWDGDSTIRQYGMVMFDTAGHIQTGAYTGSGCFDYKNHNLGSYYSVQGNILLGQQILDSIESRFLHTSGSLATRLMAALQGANIAGADTRCMNEGIPAQSSFIRVAKPTDTDSTLYLDLRVISRPYGMSPIDTLQTLLDKWQLSHPSSLKDLEEDEIKVYPNPAIESCRLQFADVKKREVEVFDTLGKKVFSTTCFTYCQIPVTAFLKGTYLIRVGNKAQKLVVQ